jgi:hypothetical protein
MNLQNKQINDLVKLRFQKANDTFAEIEVLVRHSYWRTADWIFINEDDVIPLINPVKNFIDKIEQLLTNL